MLAFLLAAGLGQAPSSATVDEFELSWQAPASCPMEAEVHALLAQQDPKGAAARAGLQSARAHVGRNEEGAYSLTATFASSNGRWVRELEAHDCQQLSEAFVVLISLEADAAKHEAKQPTQKNEERPPTPDKIESPPRRRVSTQRGTDAPRFSLAIFGSGELGLQPALAGGLGLRFSYTRGRLHVVGYSRTSFPTRTRLLAGDPAELQLFSWLTGFEGCLRLPSRARLLLPVCSFIELGPTFVSGHGTDDDRTLTRFAANVGLSLAAFINPSDRWRFGLGLQGGLQTNRPKYVVRGLPSHFRSPLGFLRLYISAGFVWHGRGHLKQ